MVVKPHGEADSRSSRFGVTSDTTARKRSSEILCSCRAPLVLDIFENVLDLVEAASERFLEDIRRQLQDGCAS